MSLYRTRVAGTGSYLPPDLITNKDLEKLVDTNDEWIRERTGISERHRALPNQATSDLAYEASLLAIKDANLEPKDIDCIIVGTVTGDYQTPSTSCVLQAKLGLNGIPAMDVGAACSGFIYILSMADAYIRMGMYKNILIVGAEVTTRFVNYKDRETCILFGDGAGAWVVSRTDTQAKDVVYSSHLRAEGSLGDLFIRPSGGSKRPFSQEVLDDNSYWFTMKGREIYKNAVRTMSATCQEALEFNKMNSSHIDWLVPHQANWRIMEAVANHFDFPKEKVISIVDQMGNTSAATIPVAFDFARKDGRIKRGQTILLTAFGAGLTAGSAVLQF
ncbi:MAG: 3-oxoacyl-ACP synthase [Bdellovibrio sp. CG10_big_fil_rev_8_21_14_0_10_47_8]|nr:MAG: 3-oxoacyl-ACP synthase [Bdellovibrio sp. CG10_big_fil_rev_8_21_14_0_10_47_8]